MLGPWTPQGLEEKGALPEVTEQVPAELPTQEPACVGALSAMGGPQMCTGPELGPTLVTPAARACACGSWGCFGGMGCHGPHAPALYLGSVVSPIPKMSLTQLYPWT